LAFSSQNEAYLVDANDAKSVFTAKPAWHMGQGTANLHLKLLVGVALLVLSQDSA